MRYLVPELAPMGGEGAAWQMLGQAARANPSGRSGRDSDAAALVEFLLSPDAEFNQGQVIHAYRGASVSA